MSRPVRDVRVKIYKWEVQYKGITSREWKSRFPIWKRISCEVASEKGNGTYLKILLISFPFLKLCQYNLLQTGNIWKDYL